MARQIVHDNNITRSQFRHENLRNTALEPIAVDRTLQHHWCDHAAHRQTGNQRGGVAVAAQKAHPQSRAFGTAAVAAGHVGGGPNLIDEDQAFRFEIDLILEPVMTLPQDIGVILFDGMASLYGMARPFSPASDMRRLLEKGNERTNVYCDPWR